MRSTHARICYRCAVCEESVYDHQPAKRRIEGVVEIVCRRHREAGEPPDGPEGGRE